MVRVWRTKSLICCLRYDPLIIFRRQNHITFIFIKTMSHDLLVQMGYLYHSIWNIQITKKTVRYVFLGNMHQCKKSKIIWFHCDNTAWEFLWFVIGVIIRTYNIQSNGSRLFKPHFPQKKKRKQILHRNFHI